jgi:hypothetical protein
LILTFGCCFDIDTSTVVYSQAAALPSTTVAAITETLDFSMPSYGEATKGEIKSSMAIPSFNPFADFEPSKVVQQTQSSSDPVAPVVKAESPATEQKQDAAKASREEKQAKKLADKQAADAAAAAKAAEKQARLAAEKEKQKANVEASKRTIETIPAAADTLNLKATEMPKFELPSMPAFSMPKNSNGGDYIDLDSIPKFKAPAMPEFSMPKNSDGGDYIDMSKFKAPSMPSFSMPQMPKNGNGDEYIDMSNFKAPSMPAFSMPQMPKNSNGGDYIDMSNFKAPDIKFPSFGGGSSSSSPEFLAPQLVRDDAARAAKATFQEYDGQAKELEATARDARSRANEKKALFQEAKDLACADRPGGKLICLRNPFSTGF